MNSSSRWTRWKSSTPAACAPRITRRAAEIAKRYGKAITAGSDAHTLREIGRGYLTLPPFRDTPEAFLDSLSKATPGGRLSGIWPHFASTFAKLGK